MKKKNLFLMFIALSLTITIFAQNKRTTIPAHLRNYAVQRTPFKAEKYPDFGEVIANPYVTNKQFTETKIGQTIYDVQSHGSIDHSRIRLYADNTIAAIWAQGSGATAPDRGTGYNYFDSTNWGAIPTTRIETASSGWGSYAPLNNGEIVISHSTVENLHMNIRPVKGSGAWTQTTLLGPTGSDLAFPRIITVGDTIHLISVSFIEYQSMESPIIYSRSVDAGTTWEHFTLPGMDFASGQYSHAADIYAWAQPKDGKIAFIYGNMRQDVRIMKSADGGNTWVMQVVFEHPNPFHFNTGTPLDTTYVTDGLLAVEFDNNGKLHATFGVVRVLDEDPTSEQVSWFPFVSYLAYWNEDFGIMTNMDIDYMYEQGRNIAELQDINGDDTLFADLDSLNQIKDYGDNGMVSQPQITIDENNHLFVTFAHVNENLKSFDDKYLRHIWAVKSINGGSTWSEPTEITGGVEHMLHECVYASMSKTSDDYIHVIFQYDEQPGTLVYNAADGHNANNNSIMYIRVLKSDIGQTSISEYNSVNSVLVFPNPAAHYANIVINSPVATNAVIRITNLLGQQVYSANKNLSAGNSQLTIDITDFSEGIYIINVNVGNKQISQKLIVK